MAEDSIRFSVNGAVAKISLNRPDKYNSFNKEMALQLQSKLEQCAADSVVRAILITGEGKAFSAGQDLSEAMDANGPGIKKIVEEHYNPIIQKIRSIAKPIVCAVNGVAAGAGANIALSCDVVIAASSASFIQAFSKIGLVPDSGGTFFLPRLVGFAKASAWMLLGDKIMAEEAERMGVIYKVVEDAKLESEAGSIAQTLAAMPTKSLGYTKQLLNQSFVTNLEQQLIAEGSLQVKCAATHDYQEGVNAFLEKRKPVFKGE
jgi:2-(1,2-epoxy-1,2-dihydrophenyl)acetyl-CoA isomerase